MLWFTDKISFATAVFFYGLSMIYSVFLWRKGFRQDNRVNYFLLMTGAVFHTAAMFKRGFSLDRCPVNNLFEATMFVMWTMIAAYLLLGIWTRLRFLGAFISPIFFGMGVFALMPSLDVRGPKPEFSGGWLSLHVALFALAYGAFGLSSVAGTMYLTQEHDLKFHKLRAVISRLPPIQRLEIVMGRLLMTGFVLLSAALAVSSVWFKQTYGNYFQDDPKILWSLLVWLMCCGLVIMRWKFAQSGRRLAWGTIGLFVFVALTFWGSSLMSPIHAPAQPTQPHSSLIVFREKQFVNRQSSIVNS
ncbi:MAG: cytochrome c biogenesis protein CcsA [Verrucomicrobiota bacterium]